MSDARPRRLRVPPRAWGLACTILLALLALLDLAPQRWLRYQGFDGVGRLLPRTRSSAPGVVVAIDEASLAAYGQWPWPRTRLAMLVERIASTNPAAIGMDMVMPEADRTSPARIAEGLPTPDPELAARISALPDHDVALGRALTGRKVVLGLAGMPAPVRGAGPVPTSPVLVRGDRAGLVRLPSYAGALSSRASIDQGAAGHGLISSEADGGVVRRMYTLGRVGEQVVPSFALELLRVASGAPALEVRSDTRGLRTVRVADLEVPVEPDGRVWLRYAASDRNRYHSALDVLDHPLDAEAFRGKLVLIALTGLGLADHVTTPLGERVPGIELHLQFLENLFDRSWLQRPPWLRPLEALLLLVTGSLLVLGMARIRPGWTLLALLLIVAALAAAECAAFSTGLLLDTAGTGAGAGIIFAVTLGATLGEAQRQRRDLREQLQRERESTARTAGELEAARRVQMGMLPDPARVLEGDARISGAAAMEPARVVGGDFYDLFRLDGRRLCALVGDVSGKGLPAAMFMTLVKARCQIAVLRHPDALEKALDDIEIEIGRENPESMFVTLLVAVLDLDSGQGEFINAGHEPGLVLDPEGEAHRLDAGTPPLGVMPGFGFEVGRFALARGGSLVLHTDGVTEAFNREQLLYGRERVLRVLRDGAALTPQDLVNAIRTDVTAFVDGAEQSDDLAGLVLRWAGPPARGEPVSAR